MIIVLPSRGHFGLPAISMRIPKIDDLRKISDLSDKDEIAKTEFVKRLLDNPEEVDKISTYDRDYLFFIAVGAITMNEYRFRVTCPSCGKVIDSSLALQDCEVKELDPEGEYTVDKEIFGEHYQFRLLSVADEKKAIDYAILDEDTYKSRYDDAVVCLTLNKDITQENIKWVRNLDLAVYFAALYYIQCCHHGIEPRKEVVCSKCGQTIVTAIPVMSTLLSFDLMSIMKKFASLAATGIDFKSFIDLSIPEYTALVEALNEKFKK